MVRECGVLLLASQSPRRRELLELGGWEFRVVPAQVDETPIPREAPEDYVLRLAGAKARAAAQQAGPGQFVVGADTAVVDQGEILGKPKSVGAAASTLRRLRGRAHQVVSAIAVLQPNGGKSITDLCLTEVPMRPYTEAELMAYVETGDPMDKAGAYAIQHPGFRPVDALHGCYANVVGLPLCHLVRALRQVGVASPRDVPALCQQAFAYDCPVYESVLRGRG